MNVIWAQSLKNIDNLWNGMSSFFAWVVKKAKGSTSHLTHETLSRILQNPPCYPILATPIKLLEMKGYSWKVQLSIYRDSLINCESFFFHQKFNKTGSQWSIFESSLICIILKTNSIYNQWPIKSNENSINLQINRLGRNSLLWT